MAGNVRLVAQDEFPDRIHMLAWYQVIIHPLLQLVELAEREAPEFRIKDVTHQPVEPGRLYLFVDFIVGLPVHPEFHVGAQHGILSLFEHTGMVGIHQNVLVEVIKFVTSREIDILGHPYGCHVVGNVQPEAFGLCEHNHIRSLLSRQREVSPYGDDAGFVVFSVFLFHDACFLPVVRSFAVALNAEIRPARPLFLGQQRSPFD